jgi:phenylpropionate dioxygenase-like ring-hydroxylating dioxygenase large terminal subunit
MSKKLSRREFARKSVAAGAAAAVAVPSALIGTAASASETTVSAAGGAAAAVSRRRRITLPPELAYGGDGWSGRGDVRLDEAPQTASYAGGWREGTTIPAEYYVDEKHFANEERFISENFWLMADHENRIPKPGDYFVFQFGRGDSLIITRDQSGAVKAFHNVCRHRGSRLAMHDELLPSEARPDGRPQDAKLSVVQLGPHGNSPVFRCPYHAWTYDLSGKLVSLPPGLPGSFKQEELGLHPAHVRTVEGFIYVSLARQEPPDFDTFTANWRNVAKEYGVKDLKIVARKSYPTKGNWKLALENFRECYHCNPSHTKSYSSVHGVFTGTSNSGMPITPQQRAQIEQELVSHGHPVRAEQQQQQRRDRLVEPPQQPAMGGGGGAGSHLKIGFVTGSLDGKPVAPLLPGREWTHRSRAVTTGFSTAYMQVYDDHVAVARFTPRNVQLTDVEIFWMVRSDAKPKDYDVPRMMALWDQTYREDRWIVENNHHGILSSRYAFTGGQPYVVSEGGPSGFVKWYMSEVVPQATRQNTAG